MRKSLFATFALLLIISCKYRNNLSTQLTNSFANHLKKIDSFAALDSVHILWNITVTQILSRIIIDSLYINDLLIVQAQFSTAIPISKLHIIYFYHTHYILY